MKKILLSATILLFLAATASAQLANWTNASKTDYPVNISGQVNGYCRITQLDFHVSNPNKMYAVTSQGGLFITTDAGENWTVAAGTEGFTFNCASLCVDRTNDQVMYLGTGDPNYYSNGSGVYKSTDGGATFTATALTNCLVIEILQHPTDPNTFVAATNKGIYRTTNNGSTWTAVTATNLKFSDLQQNTAANSLILYAGTQENSPRLYRSTDFGSTWTQITSGIVAPAIDIASGCRIGVTPADPNVVYFAEVGGYGMYFKSTDGGLNFTLKKGENAPYLTFYDNLISSSGQGNYNNTICVDRNDPNRLWMQSQNTWQSTDGGATWTMMSRWSGVLHTDHHYLVQSPYDATLLYSCNDGGVWISRDGAGTWTPKSNGLYAYEVGDNAGKSSHTDPNFISIGTQDNGRLYRNATGWYTTLGGDDYEQREFDYLPNGGYFYNFDNATRTKVPNAGTATCGIPTATIQAIGFNRTNTELGFVGNGDVYRTANLSAGTPAWTQITSFGKNIMAIHSCIANADRLYVITDDQTIYVSNDATAASPTFTAYALPTSSSTLASIAAVANNADIVYISINNKVYRSNDGGVNWTNVTYNLPNVNHRRILAEEYGGTEELVFVATNNAVYYKKAGQTTWTSYSTNLPGRRSPTDFSMFDDGTSRARIRYTSYGRAVWESPFDNLRVSQADFVADRTNNLCLSAGVVKFTDLSLGGATVWNWTFPGGTPGTSSAQNPTVTYSTPGTYDVTLTVTTSGGMFTVTKTSYITVGSTVNGATYNVGPGGDFTTLTAAVNYWNNNCIGGPVVFNLTAATYTTPAETFPLTLNANSPNATLLIKPTVNSAITGSSGTALIILNGVDKVTIDGSTGNINNTICPLSTATRNLTITNTNTSTSSAVIWLQNNGSDGATNNTIKNCTIIGNANTTTLIGLGSGSSTIGISSFGVGNHNNAFINNSIQKVQYGIYSGGESVTNKNQGSIINQNLINSVSPNNVLRTGILVRYENNIQISGNNIANMNVTSTTSAHGIALAREASTGTNSFNNFSGNEVTGATITNNVIDNIVRGATFGSAVGIYIGTVSTTGNAPTIVANNFITRVNAPTADVGYVACGIAVGGGSTSDTRVFHNSIHMTGTASNSIQTFGVVVGSSENYPTVYLKDNIISNQSTSTNRNYVIGIQYPAPYPRLFSDYNDMYVTGSNFAVVGGIYNSPAGDRATFAAWKTESGRDANSKNVLPEFTSNTDPHLNVAGANNIANLFGFGTPIANVTNDIDCESRSASAPTIGADENCASPGVPTITASTNPLCQGGNTTLTVSGALLNSATDWKWYSGSCGGTPVGSGTSITVSPSTTTTYYVRGEGRCVTPGACGSITITVGTAPTFTTCPANQSINNVTGQCAAPATYTPVISGLSPITVTYAFTGATTGSGSGNGSGSTFNVGVTTVTLTATNTCGANTCTFTITVVDNEAPSITCPANIAANATAGQCSATVNYSAPVGTDNCAGATTARIGGLASGASYPVGVTTNTYRVTAANGQTSTCSFTVTVNDIEAPSITCPAAISANSTTGQCSAAVMYSAPVGTDNCSGATTTQTGGLASGANFPVGVTTNTFRVTDAGGLTATCNFTVTVSDVQPPSITCPANIAANTASGFCSATVTYSAPVGTDNCSGPTTVQTGGLASGASFPLGVTTNTFRVTDASGLTSTCSFTVTVNDAQAPTVVCKIATANLNNAGSVTIATADVFQSGNDNCGTVNQQSVSPNTFTCANLGANTVTLTVNDGHGNTATCNATVTVADNTGPSLTCKNATVNLNGSGMASITTADVYQSGSDNCGTVNQQSVSPNSFTCGNLGANTVTLTANDGHGNTGTCTATVTVTDLNNVCNANLPPVAVCKNLTVSANGSCQATPAATDFNNGSSDPENGPLTFSISPSGPFGLGTTSVVLTVTDNGGLSSTCAATITVNDNTAPSVTCKNASVNLSAAGSASITTASVFNTGSDNCGTVNQQSVSPSSFTCANIGANTVTLTVNDGHANTATCTATVTVNDVTAPSVTCKNASVNLSAAGSVTITTADVYQSGSDNCGTVNQQSVSPSSFTCANIGTNTVTLTVNDGHANTATCAATVTVNDVTAPSVTCKNASVNLSAGGSASITTADVYNSGSDNCGTVNQQSVSPSSFTCANIGANTVTLTVNDGHGNTSTCAATVTVNDVTAPSVICKNASVNLSAAGSVTITTADVYQSGTDNCGVVNQQSVSPSSFTCANIGANTVTLTVNDGHGNTSTCAATVTVNDVTAPSVTCKNASVNLSAAGSVTITTADVYQSGSDNCGVVNQQSVSPSTFTCANIGANTVTLTVNDGHGNTATCAATVTVSDVTPPSVTCKNATANLSVAGSVTITTAAVYQTGSDNCGTVNQVSVVPSTFTCANIGANTVTLTVNDGHGNTATCNATVTVADITAPTVTCKNATVNLNAAGSASVTTADVYQSGSDNCGVVNQQSVNPNAFTCANLGDNTVTLTVNDGHGNTATCTATVTVKDLIVPTMICKNVSLNLDALGQATLTVAQVNNGSFDNCGIVNFSLSQTLFTCANVGSNSVVLNGVDASGNKGQCSATVTIVDPFPPVAKCKAATINLGPNGTITVPPALVDNGTTDNCSFTLTLTPGTFTCASIGKNTVTLRATDLSGNTSTCTASVTIKDASGPVASCANPTIFLNSLGQATLSVNLVDNGSVDNCGIATRTISKSLFNCSEISGLQPVTLTLSDQNGNTSTCISYVTVKDAIAPNPICEDVTVQLNANGKATVYGADLADGSNDNCSVWSYSPIAKVYTVANLGVNNLTVTVKDWSGNGATCVSVVTVIPFNGPSGAPNGAVNTEEYAFNVYPNPASNQVAVAFELPAEESVSLRIYDMQGRLILSREDVGLKGENTIPVSLSDITSGVYFIDFQSKDLKAQRRLIVQE